MNLKLGEMNLGTEAIDFSNLYPILARLISPAEIRNLTAHQLVELAKEVRQAILNEVSKTGGHFSSNLGAVELAVAVMAVFNPPEDKIVWDTGHQAYAHKILTGRLPRFSTMRKFGGLSGFLKRDESEYDAFGAGHAGTAISAALGFAIARDKLGGTSKAVAITGDAAIASGMSWEALNHAGELKTDLIVILNDNRMSIAPNVGALTNYLAKLRSRPFVQSMASKAKDVVHKMPDPITKVASGIRHGITHYLAPSPTGTIFEEMGFEYIGPIDGHDIPTLVEVLRNVKELKGPFFIHAITTKGKGYGVSEEDARKWHAVVPFSLESNSMVSKRGATTFTQSFGEIACALADKDEKIVAITAAMPDGTGLNDYAKRFPDRFYDVGIAEQHAVTVAAGMAAGGLKPLCAIYSTFLQRGFDQVLHDVAIQKLPVRFFMDRAGLVGDDGPTHHGMFDISFLSSIPSMVLLAPRDTDELKEMAIWMADYDLGPTAMRYPRGPSLDGLPEARTPIEYGTSEILISGNDLTIVAVGSCVGPAFEAAKLLAEEGIKATVINARFVKPIDIELISRSVQATGNLLVVEEGTRRGGFGEAVLTDLIVSGVKPDRVKLLTLPDEFVEHGTQEILRARCGLDTNGIYSEAQKLLGSKVARA